jgi:serine protease
MRTLPSLLVVTLLLAACLQIVHGRLLGTTSTSSFSGSIFSSLSKTFSSGLGLSGVTPIGLFQEDGSDNTDDATSNGQFIVRFSDSLSDDQVPIKAEQIAQAMGGGAYVRHVLTNVFKGAVIAVTTDDNNTLARSFDTASATTTVDEGMQQLFQNDDEVLHVESDRAIHASDVGNVNIQSNAPPSLDRINQVRLPLDGKFDYWYDGSGVQVYVVDTGIRLTHELFAGHAVSCGWSAFDDNCTDLNGHGTHVAGSIISKFGVAKNAELISVKVLGEYGGGSTGSVVAGLDYVIGRKNANPSIPMVINMSAGASFSRALDDAATRVTESGILLVAAAGNENKSACDVSPASNTNVMSVGATDLRTWFFFFQQDSRARYSNHGCVDIFTIGTNVESLSGKSDTGTTIMSGTSMAAPHVAGAAALYLQKDPTMTPAQLKGAMLNDASQFQMMWWTSAWSPNRMLNTANL